MLVFVFYGLSCHLLIWLELSGLLCLSDFMNIRQNSRGGADPIPRPLPHKWRRGEQKQIPAGNRYAKSPLGESRMSNCTLFSIS